MRHDERRQRARRRRRSVDGRALREAGASGRLVSVLTPTQIEHLCCSVVFSMVGFAITSSGPVITRTTYWYSFEARRGCLYLSTNHETLRILVPPAAEHVLAELPPVGTTVDLRPGMRNGYETYRLTWLCDRSVLHVIEIDLRLCDRRWPDTEDGTVAKLIWYTAGEEADAVHERRRELVQIGEVVAS